MSPNPGRPPGSGGLKWTYYDSDVLPAWVAEMDFGLAPPVSLALHDAIERGLTGYPYPEIEDAAAAAAAAAWRERIGWQVEPSQVFPAPDVIEGIRRAILHLTRPSSPVILHSPVYFPFYDMVERAGRDVIEVRCLPDADGRYSLNLDAIDTALDDGAGSIVLCNPWNPTGRVLTDRELGDVVEMATHHDARVIADEVHGMVVYDGATHTPAASIDPDRVVTVTSASKAWNLPGLKCAQVVLANERDRDAWSRAIPRDAVGVGTLGLIASAAAYSKGGAWLDDTLDRLASNRDLLSALISEHLPRVSYSEPEGTYLAWLDMGPYQLDDPASFILDEARVAVNAGGPFGTGASQFIRFNFATHGYLIREMVERIGAVLPRP